MKRWPFLIFLDMATLGVKGKLWFGLIDAPLPFSVVNDKWLDFLWHDVRVIAGDDEQVVIVDGNEDRAESETFKNGTIVIKEPFTVLSFLFSNILMIFPYVIGS